MIAPHRLLAAFALLIPLAAIVAAAPGQVRAGQPLSPQEERALSPKDTFKECDACPEMIVMPAGSFTMGTACSNDCNESPQHTVMFARPFAVGKFSVTFEEWEACVAESHGIPVRGCSYQPSFYGRGRQPVVFVSWHQAQAYVAWLSGKTGKTYRLLSEAEREYAARAGTTTLYWTGSTITKNQANFFSNKTVPVDTFEPNPWGLYQVHGNVSEWTEDCWNSTYRGAPTDGSAWLSGDCDRRRVIRGGSWADKNPWRLRSAARRFGYSSERLSGAGIADLGLRVARTLLTP